MDQVGSALSAQIAEVRPIVQGLMQLAAKNPAIQPIVQQILPQMKQIIVMLGQSAPTQTDSAMALPGGG